ncbi:MAG: response regulator [Anaerolineae bacterium]
MIALVVEDDKTLEVIYRFILERAGFEVLFATDGQQAISILETTTPALIFLDMLLPHTHGSEVLRYIRATEQLNHTRVVVISSIQNYERDIQQEEFLLKPVHAPVIARIAEETRSKFVSHC